MQYRVFMDFLDDKGRNLIHEWLLSLRVPTRQDFQRKLEALEQMQRPPTNFLKKLKHGECAGLWEVRLDRDNTEWRILGFQGPGNGQHTLAFVARERDYKFEPRSACKLAHKRRVAVLNDPKRRTCAHRWDT